VYAVTDTSTFKVWTDAFTAQYGFPVTQYREPGGPLYQRFSQELNAGTASADVLVISERTKTQEADSQGWLSPYTPENADAFEPANVLPGLAYPTYLTYAAVAWNTDLVPQDLQDQLLADPYQALLDPRLAGHLAIGNPTAGGPSLANLITVVDINGDTLGWDYLERLSAEQAPSVQTSTVTTSEGVVNGQFWATVSGTLTVYGKLAVEGAPVAFASADAVAITQDYVSVVSNAPHPYAARLFMEWMTTPEAQDALANLTQGISTLKGWENDNAVAQLPWYKAPTSFSGEWETSADYSGDALQAVYDRWSGIFE
jgi:iron(III) transport system substrate-binding protein